MNKKHLARAYKIAGKPNAYVQAFPLQREVVVSATGNISVGPKVGNVMSVIRHPTATDYGLFEVKWENQGIEILCGNQIAWSI